MTPKQYVAIRNRIQATLDRMQRKIDRSYASIVLPDISQLRRATASDIIKGNIIIYPDRPNPFWQEVAEVHRPDDDFKAYTAMDGCRYGLDGAYVYKKRAKGKRGRR